jgi:hypothetical protein
MIKWSARSLLFLLCFVAAAGGIHKLITACGYDPEESPVVIFHPSTMGKTRIYPLFLSEFSGFLLSNDMSPYGDSIGDIALLSNEQTWQNYLGKKISLDHISWLVYNYPVDSLAIISEMLREKKSVPSVFSRNDALACLIKKRDFAALDYLCFARQCEKYNNRSDWSESDKSEPDEPAAPNDSASASEVTALIDSGLVVRGQCKNKSLRFRYAFQLVRLAHHAGYYERCTHLYETFMAGQGEKNNPLTVEGRALYGGAWFRLDSVGHAFYEFSMILDKYFTYNTEKYLQNLHWANTPAGFAENGEEVAGSTTAFSYCKNNHERACVAAFHAYFDNANLNNWMRIVYADDPKNDLLDLLLTRKVNGLETDLPDSQNNNYTYGVYSVTRNPAVADIHSTISLIHSFLNVGKLKRPYLWHAAAAYLSSLVNDFPMAADEYKNALAKAPQNNFIRGSILTLELLTRLNTVNKIDSTLEATLMPQLNWLLDHKDDRYIDNARSKVFYEMGKKYYEQGDSTTGLLCLAQTRNLDGTGDVSSSQLEAISELYKKPASKFISVLLSHFSNGLFTDGGILFRIYMREEKFTKAMTANDGEEFSTYWLAPFKSQVPDCYNCYGEQPDSVYSYSLHQYAEEMASLQKEIQKPSLHQADSVYAYATGLYNLSFFGTGWMASRSYKGCYLPVYDPKISMMPDLDCCTRARQFYARSMQLYTDPEMQARSCFMAAKCERNNFYMTSHFDQWNYNAVVPDGNYFYLLHERYRETDYYQEAIDECGYFADFARRQN